MMYCSFETNFSIPFSLCDHRAQLSVPSLFNIFMDAAISHSDEIGIGERDMLSRGLFWLATRTQLQIHRLPSLSDSVTVKTWPAVPSRVRCLRYYTLSSGGFLLAQGKTEWVVSEFESGKILGSNGIYPESISFSPDTVCTSPFAKVSEAFSEDELIGSYSVSSGDIDIGRHMNNSAYVRALFSFFSLQQLDKMDVHSIDVRFCSPSYEKDVFQVFRRKADRCLEFAMKKDCKTVFLCRIE